MNESTELINEILSGLNIYTTYRTESLSLLEKGESRYIRDMKLNLASTLTSDHLSAKECALIGLATAVNNNNVPLIKYYNTYAGEQGATLAETGEAAGCASLLASNNVFTVFAILPKRKNTGRSPRASACS